MAKIISYEKSPYINKQIEIYSKNKTGEYAKYLQKNPVFITYYSINQEMSRADIGTGSINIDIGHNSPIRYNEIKEFPIYNLPELKPDVDNDDTLGIDVNMDLNGIVVLPNTIIPVPGDYMYIKLPGMKCGLLSKVTGFEHNTIQSNDFYILNCELKSTIYTNDLNNSYNNLLKQVVEYYICIFDNICTNDKCLIKKEDFNKCKKIKTIINDLKESYYDNYYRYGTFVYQNNNITYYDTYLINFLKESQLFFDDTGERYVLLAFDDSLPINFKSIFNSTLWSAVIKQTSIFLSNYIYFNWRDICKSYSIFNIEEILAYSTNLIPSDNTIDLNKENNKDYIFSYFNENLNIQIKNKNEIPVDYFDLLIYNYINQIDQSIDIESIINENFNISFKNYLYIPIIIYILQKYYDKFFESEDISNI